jgi:hypothetical protein
MRVGEGRSVDRFIVYATSAALLTAAAATFASASLHHQTRPIEASLTTKPSPAPTSSTGGNVGLF